MASRRGRAEPFVKFDGGRVTFHNVWTDDGYPVAGEMALVGGVWRLQQLRFGVPDPTGEISSTTLRRLRLDTVLAQVRAKALEITATVGGHLDRGDLQGLPEPTLEAVRAMVKAGRAAAKRPPAGSRGWGDDFYRMVAHEYVELTKAGVPGRGVLTELAKRLARRMNEPEPRHRDNVRDWVAVAKERGFIVPVGQGRGGALPGPRLYDDEGEN